MIGSNIIDGNKISEATNRVKLDNNLISRTDIALIFIFFVLGDLTTTFIALENGAEEFNIIVKYLINNYGFTSFILYKFVTTITSIFALIYADNRIEKRDDCTLLYNIYQKLPRIVLNIVIIIGVIVTFTNISTIILIT